MVTRTNNAASIYAVCVTVTATGDTEISDVVLLQEDQALIEWDVDDGSPGTNSMRYAGVNSGDSSVPPPGANSTALVDMDYSPTYHRTDAVVRETTAGQGARPVGFVDSVDDVAAVLVAISELTGNATITATTVAPTVAVPTPTIAAGAATTTSTVAVTAAAVAPTVVAGPTTTVAATTVTAVVTLPAPTISVGGGNRSVATTAVAATATVLDGWSLPATIITPRSATIITSTVAARAAVPIPTMGAKYVPEDSTGRSRHGDRNVAFRGRRNRTVRPTRGRL